MAFVLDASVSAVWAFDDEDHPIAAAARNMLLNGDAHVPSLWWYELRNTIVMNERRGRISELQSARFLKMVAELPIKLDMAPDELNLIGLARKHRLTVYDAAYLELAQRLRIPLATLDHALEAAAAAEGLRLITV